MFVLPLVLSQGRRGKRSYNEDNATLFTPAFYRFSLFIFSLVILFIAIILTVEFTCVC